MIDLNIIIVSWNTRDLLKECLESIYRYTSGITFEVFVVDNASSDGSANMVRKLFPQVSVIANNHNVGFSKANNQAIKISNGKYIALLNPDTLLIKDIFNPLIAYLEVHNNIGAIGPKILSSDRESIQYACARRLPTLYLELIDYLKLDRKFPKFFKGIYMFDWDHKTSKYVELLSGACMVIRRKAIDDIGLFDENQFMYADDVDLCKRLINSGWKIYYYADSSLIHYGGESSKKNKVFSNIKMLESTHYYYLKHHGKLHATLFCIQILILNLGKYLWRIASKKGKKEMIELLEIYKKSIRWSFREILKESLKKN